MYKYEIKSEGAYLAIKEERARDLVNKISTELEQALGYSYPGLEKAQIVEAYANALSQVISLRIEPAPRG